MDVVMVLTWIEEGRRLRLADDNPNLKDINARERSGECVLWCVDGGVCRGWRVCDARVMLVAV